MRWIACLFVMGLVGCGGPPVASVTGKVTYAGNAVATGDVNFFNKEKGAGAMAKINAGSFTLTEPIEPGNYTVYVTPPPAEPPPPGTPPAPVDQSIPMRARDPNTSGISVTLQTGPNDVAIELKD